MFSWLLDHLFPTRLYSRAYWKGRGEGWGACESMVLTRAETLGGREYKDKIWKELVQ
jgi:hypothetical protein